jgi:hypothetical protein
MISRQRPWGFMAALALTCALIMGPGFTGTAGAASEDVAMFYDDLSQHGQWVEYEQYGPVWRPTQVPEDWRPYTNGRWVPTTDGNVFESEEPWGWATYHYGNWMPTEGYGWVWVPGRTWYPSTVEWRTTPESEPVETSYVGWAPTPPPNYEPPPSYAPASYYQGAPVTDTLSSPLWIFARAASFLLGFGQPYNSGYSYLNSGYLVPPTYVPVFYPQTVFIPAYATPNYYPPAYFGGRRGGAGYYNMGPSVTYITRVTNINQTIINQTIIKNTNNFYRIHNVAPPRSVIARHGYIKQIMPPALAQGRRLPPPQLAPNVRQAQVNLNRPNFVPPPKNVPKITATIPRVQPAALQPGQGLPGTALPGKAIMPLTPQMTQQIQKLPPQQRFEPGKSRPFQPVAAQPGAAHPGSPPQPAPGQVQPGGPPKAGQFGPAPQPMQVQPGGPPKGGKAGPAIQPGPVQPGGPPKGGQLGPGTQPGQVKPVTPPAGPAKPGEFHPGVRPPGTTPGKPPAAPATPGATKPGGVPLPPGHQGLTPEQRRQQELEHQRLQRGGTPGQPVTPPKVQPQTPPKVQPVTPPRPQPQPQPRPQPQVQPRPQPQVMPKPQPQAPPPKIQPQAPPRPQPQVQPRPQPQSQPRPQPQVAPAPRPQPQPAPRPQPQPQPKKEEPKKKPPQQP